MGRSRGGLTTKIHALADRHGRPVRLALTPGQTHDSQAAAELLAELSEGAVVLADKAYGADRSPGRRTQHPRRSTRKARFCFSRRLYKARNRIERLFNKLKQFRRVATRYDKLAATFTAMIKLACVRLWLRGYESTA